MIYSQLYFSQRLREERNRSDRYGDPFSLILISLDKIDPTSRDSEYFARAIENFSRSIRLSDFLGWHSERKIGLILPDTDDDGARIVVSRLKTCFQSMKQCNLHEIAKQNGLFSVVEYPKMLKDEAVTDITADLADMSRRQDLAIATGSDRCHVSSQFLEETSLYETLRKKSRFSRLDSFARRGLDLVVSSVGLILVSPLCLLISALIKLTSKGPVLFRQGRLGKHGRVFTFLKFRTMYHNCDQNLHKDYVTGLIQRNAKKHEKNGRSYYKMTNDPRVTPFGHLLRKTSLDELPQLINVLRGEMSLVGPRPAISYEVEEYQNWQLRRILEAKPGITGLWQVSGRSTTTFDDMVRLDLRYVENQSIYLNFIILFKTLKAVLSMKGAY